MGLDLFWLLVIGGVILYLHLWMRRRRRERYIRDYAFHPALRKKVKEVYPHLTEPQLDRVFDGLRDYFLFCHRAGKRMVAMPSQVVDVAWHEFILFTRAYEQFSRKAIGRFLHHTPTEAMRSPTQAQEGIKRVWRLACVHEGIDPKEPTRLPLLFAIDAELAIEDGFRYTLNCKSNPNSGDYCAGHIGCSSGCAGDSGSDGDGSGCGGGCGGD